MKLLSSTVLFYLCEPPIYPPICINKDIKVMVFLPTRYNKVNRLTLYLCTPDRVYELVLPRRQRSLLLHKYSKLTLLPNWGELFLNCMGGGGNLFLSFT